MTAHRYWRAVGLEAYGTGDLELSEFHLLAASVRVDATATLTSNTAPDVSGTLANLQDDVLTTAARWSGQAVKALVLSWDFGGSPVAVEDIQFAGDSQVRFLLIVKMQWSDDSTLWTDYSTPAGITWPGAMAKTLTPIIQLSGDPNFSSVVSLMTMDGSNGSTDFSDATGKTWTAIGAAALSTAQGVGGGSSLELFGTGTGIRTISSDFAFGTGDFTIEFWVYPKTSADGGVGNLGTADSSLKCNRLIMQL